MGTKILIIDDDESIRKVLRTLLKQTGYEFLEALEPQTTFDLLKEHGGEIEAVLCDVNMPNTNGIKLLEEIKQEYETLPVIVLTGSIDLSVAVEAMKKGAFDFLTKPVKKNDLILIVEKALNHKKMLDSYKKLQSEHQQYYHGFEKVLDEKAKELELIALQLNKIREDLLTLKGSSNSDS